MPFHHIIFHGLHLVINNISNDLIINFGIGSTDNTQNMYYKFPIAFTHSHKAFAIHNGILNEATTMYHWWIHSYPVIPNLDGMYCCKPYTGPSSWNIFAIGY